MHEQKERPGVGVGVYIRKDGKVLIGKRKNTHGTGPWCALGGHLDMGESWEECARREVREEAGIEIDNIHLGNVTNDIFPDGKHYVTLNLVADWKSGEPKLMEPDKFEQGWQWFELDKLPQPLFLSARNFFESGYNLFNI